jgi:hypothetical protein
LEIGAKKVASSYAAVRETSSNNDAESERIVLPDPITRSTSKLPEIKNTRMRRLVNRLRRILTERGCGAFVIRSFIRYIRTVEESLGDDERLAI